MEPILQLYRDWCGTSPLTVERLPKAGSNRHYVRLSSPDAPSVIGVTGSDVRENRCFIYLSRHFASRGLPVPRILAVSPDATCYLQTDLGHTSLYDALRPARLAASYSTDDSALIARTIRLLPHLQVTGAEGLDTTRLLPPEVFTPRAAMFDLHYFKYCFLRTADLPVDELRLEDDFERLATCLAETADGVPATFLYRDFQARNVMLAPDGAPHFIDFQGGQLGPLQYDVASFLWQASARYPQTLRNAMIDEYVEELHALISFDETAFRSRLHLFVLFRILQVLGAYGLRGYFERKQYFLDSIPPAIQNLRRQILDGVCTPFPYLESVLRRLVDLPRFDATPAPAATRGPLVVRVVSFSYKRGLPADPSGNGGGYVFDCRATHNPGRYEPYKHLTGLDPAVISFLETDGEILPFLQHACALADAHVARYIERGFTSLMFCFGCTGGQHRSVYSAQHLAEHLHRKFGIEVRLLHREQGISQTFPAKP